MDDKYLFLGTKNGCVRIISIRNIMQISTIHIVRLFKKNKPLNTI